MGPKRQHGVQVPQCEVPGGSPRGDLLSTAPAYDRFSAAASKAAAKAEDRKSSRTGYREPPRHNPPPPHLLGFPRTNGAPFPALLRLPPQGAHATTNSRLLEYFRHCKTWRNLTAANSGIPRIKASDVRIPRSYKEAISGKYSDYWLKAIDTEYAALQEMGTWEECDLPEGQEDCEVQVGL